ncbi:hypothetical protein HNP37_004469 [Flavobacterium nitrogenifigens]|uniref:RNA polymerase sigma factor, sigma-70 family n=2 Tax=Flavobacterium TaxID=237 RepID=A0A7W7J1B5_9FLAO|nr:MULTISPECIES: hypothetical protein [Flavobacterium]MBB4804382.1 hypothetical protein [Flavobacterium nitrogenifigens]MBB6389222.1 hypothetical protein [Flavobacterium notoginsengisoli]
MDLSKQNEYLQNRSELLKLADEELIHKIIEDQEYISVIYEKFYAKYTNDFARKYRDLDYDIIDYFVSEAIVILLYKIKEHGATLLERKEPGKTRYTIASYLSGICRNQILKERNKTNNLEPHYDNHGDYYNDDLDESTIYPEPVTVNQEQEFTFDIDQKTDIMVKSLNLLKAKGRRCYTLIVLSSSKNRHKIQHITEFFQYKSDNVTRTQKYKCIQRLKRIYNNFQLT